jgi:hypothetical protein
MPIVLIVSAVAGLIYGFAFEAGCDGYRWCKKQCVAKKETISTVGRGPENEKKG